MNKKEEKWRMEGASYALRIAKEKGIVEMIRLLGIEISRFEKAISEIRME